jgi:hypothetical protein
MQRELTGVRSYNVIALVFLLTFILTTEARRIVRIRRLGRNETHSSTVVLRHCCLSRSVRKDYQEDTVESTYLLFVNLKLGKIPSNTRQTNRLDTMVSTKKSDPSTSTHQRPSIHVERLPKATTLIDAYPNNFVVRYMMPTTVSQFIASVNRANISQLGVLADIFTGRCWEFSHSCSSLTSLAPFGTRKISVLRGSAIWRMGWEWDCLR